MKLDAIWFGSLQHFTNNTHIYESTNISSVSISACFNVVYIFVIRIQTSRSKHKTNKKCFYLARRRYSPAYWIDGTHPYIYSEKENNYMSRPTCFNVVYIFILRIQTSRCEHRTNTIFGYFSCLISLHIGLTELTQTYSNNKNN